ncbi:uncharacterized protein [Anabrus simplex]|uniref:uncharacterized protein n=1 Tax=Anabrus simplex TaxID=316456 RepID=UPI0035A36D15
MLFAALCDSLRLNVTVSSPGDVTFATKGKVTVTTQGNVSVTTKENITITTQGNITVASPGSDVSEGVLVTVGAANSQRVVKVVVSQREESSPENLQFTTEMPVVTTDTAVLSSPLETTTQIPADLADTTIAVCPAETTTRGYEEFPELGRYKVYLDMEAMNWSDARDACLREGAQLMVFNSDREREQVYWVLYNQTIGYSPWVGYWDVDGNNTWLSVRGDPFPSSWWRPGFPKDTGKYCALAWSDGLIYNFYCHAKQPFICEKL